jgi:hypothetical protein
VLIANLPYMKKGVVYTGTERQTEREREMQNIVPTLTMRCHNCSMHDLPLQADTVTA